jgi:hypothetical protein
MWGFFSSYKSKKVQKFHLFCCFLSAWGTQKNYPSSKFYKTYVRLFVITTSFYYNNNNNDDKLTHVSKSTQTKCKEI